MFFKKRSEKVDEIFKRIQNKNLIKRYFTLLVGCSLIAFAFDLFFAPNSIVYGGLSGLSIVLNKTLNIDKSLFILIASIILLIISYFTLGWEKTKGSIAGSIIYPVMIKVLDPVAASIDLDTNNILLIIVFGALINGFGSGINFKSGFSTGGTDILNQIVAKYGKMSIGKAMLFTDGIIVLGAGFFLNNHIYAFENVMYAIIVLYIISLIADKVILGISQCKSFYIVTEHETDVKRFIMDHLSSGVTVLDGRGGYTGNHQKVIMCIIPTKDYFLAKEGILSIDPNAFFLVTDAYEVSGGSVRRSV
jgi:uncharacterized membrane-anchored protein YitT (DUF2179 family)